MTEIKRVVALGFFDGVHLGHGALMEMTARRSRELNAAPAVISFDTHPDTLVKGVEVPLINSTADRENLIRRIYGIQTVILVHFDRKMMETPWEVFAARLREELNVVHFVVGHDFRFGNKGEGNPERLAAFCKAHGLGLDVIPAVSLDGITVSSTHIRSLLTAGDVETANAFLGHPHTLVDTVRGGFRFGRTIGAPTINMRFPKDVLVPRFGVYATKAYFDEKAYSAVTNIGVRPTVGGVDQVSVESHILDFSGDLYGKQVRLEFFDFLRAEQRFETVDALREQISRDAQATRAYFEAKAQ